MVNVLNDLKCRRFAMSDVQVIQYPIHEVVLKHAFYKLV